MISKDDKKNIIELSNLFIDSIANDYMIFETHLHNIFNLIHHIKEEKQVNKYEIDRIKIIFLLYDELNCFISCSDKLNILSFLMRDSNYQLENNLQRKIDSNDLNTINFSNFLDSIKHSQNSHTKKPELSSIDDLLDDNSGFLNFEPSFNHEKNFGRKEELPRGVL